MAVDLFYGLEVAVTGAKRLTAPGWAFGNKQFTTASTYCYFNHSMMYSLMLLPSNYCKIIKAIIASLAVNMMHNLITIKGSFEIFHHCKNMLRYIAIRPSIGMIRLSNQYITITKPSLPTLPSRVRFTSPTAFRSTHIWHYNTYKRGCQI